MSPLDVVLLYAQLVRSVSEIQVRTHLKRLECWDLQARNKRSSHFGSQDSWEILPMSIQGTTIAAQADTGAHGGNCMSASLASSLGLNIATKKRDRKVFVLGNGRRLRSIGRVETPCSFAKEAGRSMRCSFNVFKTFAVPLIMGSDFLEETKTMQSEYSHRLEEVPLAATLKPMMCNLISPSQRNSRRLESFINGRLTYVNPDSGSQRNLMSLAYANSLGLIIDRRREAKCILRFPDNTRAETLGSVITSLEMRNGERYTEHFDVLPGLTSDVILGGVTLRGIKAFDIHVDDFVDVSTTHDLTQLDAIIYLGKVSAFLAHCFSFQQFKTRGKGHYCRTNLKVDHIRPTG
ncbi:MAG: hypothetical protein M1828_005426 [Chrysothrix sp. TS-e1954]|nr:MAG: hypothetical protein M1828_005426 [Chrysothrix sp. TS-e1954]